MVAILSAVYMQVKALFGGVEKLDCHYLSSMVYSDIPQMRRLVYEKG
jgi:hypothetical protein